MSPGAVFKRPKLELVDALILMANSMYEVGRKQTSIGYYYLSLEAIHLASAIIHSSLVSEKGYIIGFVLHLLSPYMVD